MLRRRRQSAPGRFVQVGDGQSYALWQHDLYGLSGVDAA